MKLADCKVYQIVKKSEVLRKDTKAKALRGTRKMVKNKSYAKKVYFDNFPFIIGAFFWCRTDEGNKFWHRVDKKIREEQK